ncbi:hypothetical protein GGH96_001654 [Coemansia sp. RSA 1972]|nr:hypothetical protein GGH96_001654 [Coemansia sp. RSA 1972]
MSKNFVHDSSRSSIRKRTKRRKQHVQKPKQIECTEPVNSLAGDIEWLAQLCGESGQAWMDQGVPQGSRQPSPSSDVDRMPDLSLLLKPDVDPMAALLSPPVSAHELNLLDPQFWSVPKSGFDLDELFKPQVSNEPNASIDKLTILRPHAAQLVSRPLIKLPEFGQTFERKPSKEAPETENKEDKDGFWQVPQVMDFENIGVSHTAQDGSKYLSCADCDLAPIGIQTAGGNVEFLIATSRISYYSK